MKMKLLLGTLCLCFGLTVATPPYPVTSYQLSEDGKTLVKWLGEETDVDLSADPAFSQVTTIEKHAFYRNPSTLQNLTLSANISYVNTQAFLRETPNVNFASFSLKNIFVHPDNATYESVDGVLFDKKDPEKKILWLYPWARTFEPVYKVPEKTWKVMDNALAWYGRGSNSLTIEFPEGFENVGYRGMVFANVEKIIFPSSTKTFGRLSVSTSALTQLVIKATTPPTTGVQAFNENHVSNISLFVPESSIAAYQGKVPYSNMKEISPMLITDIKYESELDQGIRIFGNSLMINLVGSDNKIEIFNISGQCVLSTITNFTCLNLNLKNGMYVLKVNEKIVKFFVTN